MTMVVVYAHVLNQAAKKCPILYALEEIRNEAKWNAENTHVPYLHAPSSYCCRKSVQNSHDSHISRHSDAPFSFQFHFQSIFLQIEKQQAGQFFFHRAYIFQQPLHISGGVTFFRQCNPCFSTIFCVVFSSNMGRTIKGEKY